MKPGIHPEYEVAKITCACGRVTETRSTVGEIHVEICSHCHPFFTGRQKLVDTAGRVERFMAKYGDRRAPAPEPEMRESSEAEAEVEETPAAKASAPEAEVAEAPEAEAPEATATESQGDGGEAGETEEEPVPAES